MRIALVVFLSITAIGSTTPAHACPVDIACEPRFWDWIDNREECEKRKAYCLGINKCWWDSGWSQSSVEDYRRDVILPGYERCVRKFSK